jgi:hypothetical protein
MATCVSEITMCGGNIVTEEQQRVTIVKGMKVRV